MSKGFALSLLASALMGSLIILPLSLQGFSVAEIIFGRYLVFFLIIFSIFLFRREAFSRPEPGDFCAFFLIALLGAVYYLFLCLGVREQCGTFACLLMATLPIWSTRVLDRAPGKSGITTLPLLMMLLCGLLLVSLCPWMDGTLEMQEQFPEYGFAQGSLDYPGKVGSWGLFYLASAGVSWLLAAGLQAHMVRSRPGIDLSDRFILTGLSSAGIVLMMLPFLGLGSGELGLFAEAKSEADWKEYWLSMAYAALGATLLARLLWRKAALYSPGEQAYGGAYLVPLCSLIYLFAYQQRWPSQVEWWALTLCIAGWCGYSRSFMASRVMKA